MPAIEATLEQTDAIKTAHGEFTAETRNIETLVIGPPLFSGAGQTGWTLIISDDFAAFLSARGTAYKAA